MAEPPLQYDRESTFWAEHWENTKLADLRKLSRKQIARYYDYFSEAHYQTAYNTNTHRVHVASEDRMTALQSELQRRQTRNLQLFVAGIGASVVIVVALVQYGNPSRGSANAATPKIQISPASSVSSSPPSP